jgi:hypothetical protein
LTAVTDGCYAAYDDGSMMACFDMMAGQYHDAGIVCAELVNGGNGDMVKITYDTSSTDYCLIEVQAYLGSSIPVGSTGNPNVGLFPAKATMTADDCVQTVTVTMPLVPGCADGASYMDEMLKLAAHASVEFADGSGGETAWSVGQDINNGGSWASYSEASLSCHCVVPTKAPTKVRKAIQWFLL